MFRVLGRAGTRAAMVAEEESIVAGLGDSSRLGESVAGENAFRWARPREPPVQTLVAEEQPALRGAVEEPRTFGNDFQGATETRNPMTTRAKPRLTLKRAVGAATGTGATGLLGYHLVQEDGDLPNALGDLGKDLGRLLGGTLDGATGGNWMWYIAGAVGAYYLVTRD